ncbi:MAG TPA: hypothetical protein VES69_00595, partial [Pyrinomonadaceae bacterium]|nr:hypothetical protein [Pyrinomonadaceae bacterium]
FYICPINAHYLFGIDFYAGAEMKGSMTCSMKVAPAWRRIVSPNFARSMAACSFSTAFTVVVRES